jgi:thiamine kinase
MRKIGSGHKSDVFLLPDGRILKLFVPEFVALAPEEAAIADMLERAGVDAPRVEDVRQVDGRPALVFGNLPLGKTLGSDVRTRPWRIVAAARDLAARHAAVHTHSSMELPAQRQRLEKEIETAEGVPAEARRLSLELLADLPDGSAVCHNDIHMLNVIVHPGGSKVIDWMLATRGNPLADVASARLQLRFGEAPKGLAARTALELGRAVFSRAYLQRYLAIRPVAVDELAAWELPVATALAGRRAGRMRAQLVARIETLLRQGRVRLVPARS